MRRNKIIAIICIAIAITGFGLAIYQYNYGRGRIPTVLFSILLLFVGLSIMKRKV